MNEDKRITFYIEYTKENQFQFPIRIYSTKQRKLITLHDEKTIYNQTIGFNNNEIIIGNEKPQIYDIEDLVTNIALTNSSGISYHITYMNKNYYLSTEEILAIYIYQFRRIIQRKYIISDIQIEFPKSFGKMVGETLQISKQSEINKIIKVIQMTFVKAIHLIGLGNIPIKFNTETISHKITIEQSQIDSVNDILFQQNDYLKFKKQIEKLKQRIVEVHESNEMIHQSNLLFNRQFSHQFKQNQLHQNEENKQDDKSTKTTDIQSLESTRKQKSNKLLFKLIEKLDVTKLMESDDILDLNEEDDPKAIKDKRCLQIMSIDPNKEYQIGRYNELISLFNCYERSKLKICQLEHAHYFYHISKWFTSIEDFINLELAVKKCKGNVSKFTYNPVPLTLKTRHIFPSLKTLHIYSPNDPLFTGDKRIIERVWCYDYQLSIDQRKQLEDWTQKKFGEIVFDSRKDNWKENTSTFNSQIIGKKQLLFVIEDENNEIFGYYLSCQGVEEYYKSILMVNQESFHFNIQSNGRLDCYRRFLVCDKNWGGYWIYPPSHKRLVSLGDIMIMKEDQKDQSRCYQDNANFFYGNIKNALCGKTGYSQNGTFTPKRILVIEMM